MNAIIQFERKRSNQTTAIFAKYVPQMIEALEDDFEVTSGFLDQKDMIVYHHRIRDVMLYILRKASGASWRKLEEHIDRDQTGMRMMAKRASDCAKSNPEVYGPEIERLVALCRSIAIHLMTTAEREIVKVEALFREGGDSIQCVVQSVSGTTSGNRHPADPGGISRV